MTGEEEVFNPSDITFDEGSDGNDDKEIKEEGVGAIEGKEDIVDDESKLDEEKVGDEGQTTTTTTSEDDPKGEDEEITETTSTDDDEEFEDIPDDEIPDLIEGRSDEVKHKVLSKVMNDLGYVEGDVNNLDDVVGAFGQLFVDNLSNDQRRVYDAVSRGIPLEEVVSMNQKRLSYDRYKEDELDDVDKAAEIYKQYLLDSNVDPSEVETIVNYAIDSDNITQKAKQAQKKGIQLFDKLEKQRLDEADKLKQKASENEIARKNKIKSDVDAKSDVWGIKLSKADKDKLYDMLANPVDIRNQDGFNIPITALNKAIENDESILMQINYLLHKGVLGKSGNLNALSTVLHSKVAKDIDNATKTKRRRRKSKADPAVEKEIDEKLGKGVESLNKMFGNLRT